MQQHVLIDLHRTAQQAGPVESDKRGRQGDKQAPWQADRGTMVRLEILSAELGAIKERTEELQLYVSRP